MATAYTQDELRSLFQSSFNLKQWYSFLQHFFNASELKEKPEPIIKDTTDEGYYLGNIDTKDHYHIGFFCYSIRKGSVANKRVGLRNLVKSFINPTWGIFDAALVVFDSGDHWRLSFISDIKGDATSPKRYTYVFGSNELLYKTPIERFRFLQDKGISFENLKTAFSVEALSDEFFDKYREQYADFIQYVTGKRFVKVGNKWEEKLLGEPDAALMQAFNYNEKKIRDYVKKMMGRITFLHFLQRKRWMCGDLNYMQNLFENSKYKNDYLDSVLEPLFFGILNTKPDNREALFTEYGWDKTLLEEWKDIPYLNGGLFERDEDDEPESKFPADYFKRLFQFFSEYNFTIDENDPNDAEIGVDPEMLGKIFENLLEDNKDKGAFYTPKEIVRYMCQESLIAYLNTCTSIAGDKIRRFVISPEESVADIPENKRPKLLSALESVKICDPAIGSGAFPMGLLNELLRCREALSGKHYNRAEIKKSIIQNNIYGVDIEKGAVDIARLRFWLSIVVDEDTPSPLPNLDYKIMQGNSLLESFMGVDLSKLTYEKESKNDKGEISLFDDEKNRLQKTVSHLLTSYFSCFDHDKKVKLQQDISDTINKQLEAQAYDATILQELKNINLAENNKFFLWHTWFSDVFDRADDKNGFDIVIGNPPYGVSIKGEYRKSVVDTLGKVPDYEIYYYFIQIAHILLKNKGLLSYIIPNTYLFNTYAKNYRTKILDDWNIKEILDCTKFPIFKSAVVRNTINIWQKDSSVSDLIGYRNTQDVTSFASLIMRQKEYITKHDLLLMCQNWSLAFSRSFDVIQLVNKIKYNKSTIVGVFPEISQGLIAYDKYRGQSADIIKNRVYHSFEYKEGLKKWLWGEDVKRYIVKWNGKEYIDYCAGIANPRHPKFFRNKRLLIREITNPSIYVAITSEELYNDPAIIIVLDNINSDYSIETILAILNSKLATFYHFNHSPKATKGAFPKILVQDIKDFPIPDISKEINEKLEHLANEIISRKEIDPAADVAKEEQEIDRIVYHIYDLTYDEVLIVDPQTTIMREEYRN